MSTLQDDILQLANMKISAADEILAQIKDIKAALANKQITAQDATELLKDMQTADEVVALENNVQVHDLAKMCIQKMLSIVEMMVPIP